MDPVAVRNCVWFLLVWNCVWFLLLADGWLFVELFVAGWFWLIWTCWLVNLTSIDLKMIGKNHGAMLIFDWTLHCCRFAGWLVSINGTNLFAVVQYVVLYCIVLPACCCTVPVSNLRDLLFHSSWWNYLGPCYFAVPGSMSKVALDIYLSMVLRLQTAILMDGW